MDILSLLLQLSFFAVFGASVWRYVRRRGPIEFALVAVFSTTAGIFAISLLETLAPGVSSTLRPLALALLVAQPVLVFWLVSLIRPLPVWSFAVVLGGFGLAAALVLIPAEILPAAALFVAFYFAVIEGAAAALLLKESQRRYGVARLRLAIAGVATALFGTSIFLAGVGAAAAGPDGTDARVLLLSRLAALSAALGYIGAFVPPRWLRNVGQRAVAFDLARRLVTAQAGTEPGLLWRSLALGARDILGSRSVSIASAQGEMLADTVDQPAPLKRGGVARASVPMVVDGELRATLVAELEGQPLFVEDDLEVLALLGLMTIRTVERDQAVLRLAEANRELAESAAVRASEARFRALLEAHPNAVLAVDGEGLVSWATGPTGQLFGRPARELQGVALSDLIELDAAGLAGFGGEEENGDRRLETSGRRLDGTAFPADVASAGFNLDGQRQELFVVSDASWRHEANLLRDRFLGILSHELRTPITSIYGGTQLLLRRGERLGAESRQELLGGIAAESERLQRIIENLLVLARVERGADFFEPRPVVVKPVLAELVERERPLWPEMSINLSIPGGLPLISADEEYLSLILRNLLSNAAKYAGPRSAVDIVVQPAAGEVQFLVRDDGPGIRPEEAEQLFSLYFRSPSGTTAPGAGIGLFVCRGLVSAMNGRIWARPRSEGGAEFGFALPVYREAAESATHEEQASPADTPSLLPGLGQAGHA